MSNHIDRMIFLVERGWHPYTGAVDVAVYEELGCPVPLFAKWLYEGESAQNAVCVGCECYCTAQCNEGFTPAPQLVKKVFSGVNHYYSLTQKEMAQRLSLLRVEQAAYCLNVSIRTIYNMVESGELVATKKKPVRISASSVIMAMNDFDV